MNFNISKYYFTTDNLFEGLLKDHLSMLKNSVKRLEKKKGKIIFKKGSYSNGVYVLRKGKVKIYRTNPDGKTQILYIYKKGEFFGYKPLLCNETHPVTAEVLEDAVISFIPKLRFLQVLKVSSQLSNKLLFNLSQEFSVWVNTTTLFAQQSVKERFALTLLILNEKFKSKNGSEPVELNLSREDIASYVGTAIETLVRIIKEFKEKSILEVKGRKIKIVNVKALIEMTEYY
jgi:CRP-like cAMP-binding protein